MAVKANMVFFDQSLDAAVPEPTPVPVSFNPSTLDIRMESQSTETRSAGDKLEGVNQKAAQKDVVQVGKRSVQTVSMSLKFDLVAAYAAAQEGKRTDTEQADVSALVAVYDSGAGAGTDGALLDPADYTDFSLMNPECTCYSKLERAAAYNLPVSFRWGTMSFTGLLTSFSSTLTYFSDQGAPLRADVSITLRCLGGAETAAAAPAAAES